MASGTTFQELSGTSAARLPIPLAPLPEQQRIVAAIEEQFTRLDAAVAALKRVRANLQRYRASVLKAACEGRLVPTEAELARQEGREYEPASVLLERIALGTEAQKTRPTSAGPTAGQVHVPEGWCGTTASSVTINLDGKRIPVKVEDRQQMQGPYPYYGASGIIDHVNQYLFDGTYLLVAEDGANLLSRSTPIAFIANGRFWVNNHAHVLQAKEGVNLKYLQCVLNNTDLQHVVTGTAQPKLTQAQLNRLWVSLPPSDEQHRIVSEMEHRLSVVDELETTVAQQLQRAERLRQAILKRAFEGRLVPQDSNDETAGVLLERIKAERQSQPAAAKPRRGKSGAQLPMVLA